MYLQGCSLLELAAQRAASNKVNKVSSSIFFLLKALALQRLRINSWMGCFVLASFGIVKFLFVNIVSSSEVENYLMFFLASRLRSKWHNPPLHRHWHFHQ